MLHQIVHQSDNLQVKSPILVKNVDWTNDYVSRRVKLQLGQQGDLKATLPNIAEFGMVVAPMVFSGEVGVEIFVSS